MYADQHQYNNSGVIMNFDIEPYCPTSHRDGVRLVERQAREHPWSNARLIMLLNLRATRTFVACDQGFVAGFAISHIHTRSNTLELITVCVLSEFRRRGIGTRLINAVLDCAGDNELDVICEIKERNLDVQMTMKAVGLLCTKIVSFSPEEDSLYVFQLEPNASVFTPYDY